MGNEQVWIFTFGSGQKHSCHFVKIKGTFESAREEMFARFGKEWAFQYSEEEWDDWCKRAEKIGCRVEKELK